MTAPSPESPVVVAPLTAADEAGYDAYVAGRAGATLYHLRAWKDVVEEAYGLEAPFLVARAGAAGAIRGVLPLMRVARPLSPYYTTGCFGAYGALLADDEDAGRALVRAACARVDEGRAKYLHLKLLGKPPAWTGLASASPSLIARTDLRESAEAAWAALKSRLRNEIRRGERSGLSPASGRGELAGFYDVLGENMHRKGSPMYGLPFFRALLARLAGRCDLVTLRLAGRTVAAAFVAWFRGVMYVPFASARPEVFKLRANYLLWWEIFKRAHAEGLKVLDFGTTPRTSSNLVFKGKWNTRFEPVYASFYAPGLLRPVLRAEDSRVASLAVRAWSRLPRRVAEALGPKISGWIA